MVQRWPAGQTGRPKAAPGLTAPGPLPSAEPPSDAPRRATYRLEEATTLGPPLDAPSSGAAPSRAEPPARRAFRLRIGSPISGEVETRSVGAGAVPTPSTTPRETMQRDDARETTQRETTDAPTGSSSPPLSPGTPIASQPGTQVTTPQPESEAGLRADEPVGPDLPLPVHPLETALVPPSAPGPGTAPTLGASDLAELYDGPDRAPAPGPHGGLQAGAAHSVATGTPMVQKDGTAGSRSVAFPAGRAEAAPIQLDMDAPAAPGAPPLLEAAVPGLPGPRQPYLPVTAPAAAPTSGTPEPVAAPPSAVSAHFELTTDAAHGRPEEYEPSRPTEDVSPEPGGTEAAPTLGVALNVQATSAFDDPPDDERQVVEPYVPPLGALHTPASVAPAPSETGISSPPAALFSAPSEVGSGPEPTPHRDGPSAAEAGGDPGADSLSFSVPAFSVPAFSVPVFSVPASSVPAASVPPLSSPKGSVAGREGRTAPDLQRVVVSKWQGADVGMSGPGTARQPGTANSPVAPSGHGTIGSPRALPGPPAQRQADASRPYETGPLGDPTSFQAGREPMDLPAIAGSGTASLVGGRLPDLVVARTQWSAAPQRSAAPQPVSPVTPTEPAANPGDPRWARGESSPVLPSSWPRGHVPGDVVQVNSLPLLSTPTMVQRAPAAKAGPTLQFPLPGVPSSTFPPQPPVTALATSEQMSPLGGPPDSVQRAGDAPAVLPRNRRVTPPAAEPASPPSNQERAATTSMTSAAGCMTGSGTGSRPSCT